MARLAGEYTDIHGYVPDRDTVARLAGQAVLMDRPACEPRSWAAERQHWLARSAEVLSVTPDQVGPTLVGAAVGVGRPLRTDPVSWDGAAEKVLDRLGERGATWNGRDIEREAAAVLREAGLRVNDVAVAKLVAVVEGHDESVSLNLPDVGGVVPDVLRRADGSSVFVRRGEELFTARAILDAERELAARAAGREMPIAETDRRFAAGWAELEDDDLIRRVAAADTRIADLAAGIIQAETDAPGLERTAADATAAVARVRTHTAASAAVRVELAAEEVAAVRLAEIETALAVGELRGPRRAERERLTDEARALRSAHPAICLDPRSRSDRAADRTQRAATLDARAIAEAQATADTATQVVKRHRTKLELLVAARAEQTEGRDALAAELAVREQMAGRVSMAGYLDGLGVDQAAAMVRLADPSAPLAALIGPAGSGKTTALATLVRAHTDAGRGVHVLAPTAVAAGGLSEAVGLPGKTVAKALSEWDRGRALPAKGDLILIDEASMATTLDVQDVVRVATEHGALCV